MTTLVHPPAHRLAPPPVRSGGRTHWVVQSIVCVLLAATAVGFLITVASGLHVDRPLPAFVSALNRDDTAALSELLTPDGEPWLTHSGWLIATEAELFLTACDTDTDGLVTCEVHFGDRWFYNRAAPPRQGHLVTSLTVEIIEEHLRVADWLMPEGLDTVEESFRLWVLQTHPDLAEFMWYMAPTGQGTRFQMRIDSAGGEAHRGLLEEYLRSLTLRERG